MLKKHFNGVFCCAVVILSSVVVSENSLAQSNTAPSPIWDKLAAQQDQRFEAQWELKTTSKPKPSFDAEDYIARLQSKEDATVKLPDDAAKKMREGQVRFAKAIREGTTLTTNLNIVRGSNAIRAEVAATDGLRSSNKFIDFYDGNNALSLVEMNQYQHGVEKKIYKGTVTRISTGILSHSAPDDLPILLAQAPVSMYYNAQNAHVTIQGGKVYLKKSIISQTSQGPLDLGDATQLVLSVTELSPISLQTVNKKGEVTSEFVVEKYEEKAGKNYPSLIVSRNSASDGPGGVTNEYKLIRSAHNDQVDLSQLKLPTSAMVGDYRFGDENGVPYQLKNGILLSDAEVKKLLGERAQQSTKQTTRQSSASFPIAIIAGLCLSLVGGMMWKKGT